MNNNYIYAMSNKQTYHSLIIIFDFFFFSNYLVDQEVLITETRRTRFEIGNNKFREIGFKIIIIPIYDFFRYFASNIDSNIKSEFLFSKNFSANFPIFSICLVIVW